MAIESKKNNLRLPDNEYEMDANLNGYHVVAGVDEAGRGPLAGPVVAAAVILKDNIYGINDSKRLSKTKRLKLFTRIHREALSVGVGVASVREIETINILKASLLAMQRAVKGLDYIPDMVIVDGKFIIPDLSIHQQSIVGGDGISISVAAASIIAKVFRDRIMEGYNALYPFYNFKKNMGYPTKEHRMALKKYGKSPVHRNTFRGVNS